MTTDTAVRRLYDARRRDHYLPPYALRWARDEVALRAAEIDDRVRVVLAVDDDYRPELAGDDPESRDWYAKDLAAWKNGDVTAYGVVLYVPDTCPHCGHVLEPDVIAADDLPGWHAAGSLWGIVVESDDDPYLREVAHDLAHEAGVIG